MGNPIEQNKYIDFKLATRYWVDITTTLDHPGRVDGKIPQSKKDAYKKAVKDWKDYYRSTYGEDQKWVMAPLKIQRYLNICLRYLGTHSEIQL